MGWGEEEKKRNKLPCRPFYQFNSCYPANNFAKEKKQPLVVLSLGAPRGHQPVTQVAVSIKRWLAIPNNQSGTVSV
jgi:hypothetical protein